MDALDSNGWPRLIRTKSDTNLYETVAGARDQFSKVP
ncbi:hypothetical protein Cycma_3004 [Cyclobacterium marinum DSM 745]|uniref:Uncharacterized protein n=1 Tax=Cyclobacterium marinum (strain ATCC 25205 / DSM 745 / LMG 13164 / NCIMB 1802) TaxID=880070 RepID=G0J548_CYCMS|nr:hypothetical protein Cycma_3004 [Cyclobacterium marinum DSM 745]